MALTYEYISYTFYALSDPTRLKILHRLSRKEATVTELSAPFDMSMPAITKHLKVLEKAGLITRDRVAQRRPCRIHPAGFKYAEKWIESYRQIWEARVESPQKKKKQLRKLHENDRYYQLPLC
ncbi:MAG: ArsR family transcriptional regulator [Candidatus Margulisbacteria bacterium]|nr:ArsR family transcriptional regulator [Candidatus Margulisiibacteriota bacterium]